MAHRFLAKPFKRIDSSYTPYIFIVISIIIHIIGVMFIDIEIEEYKEEYIQLYSLDSIDAQHIKKEFKKEEKKDKKAARVSGQVVDIAPPETEEKPEEKTSFISRYDTKVSKQKKADFDKNITLRDKKLRRKVALKIEPKEVNVRDRLIVSNRTGKDDRQLKIKKGHLKGFNGTNGDYQAGGDEEEKGLITGKDKEDKDGGTQIGRSVPSRFLPYFQGQDQYLSSPSDDHLQDVDKGDETELNTKKYLFAQYFVNFKRAISRHWDPGKLMVIHDPYRQIYEYKGRLTRLTIILDKTGNIHKIDVAVSSGIDFLDREAINAVKIASPFSTPPKEILEDGKVKIDFGFYIH